MGEGGKTTLYELGQGTTRNGGLGDPCQGKEKKGLSAAPNRDRGLL